MSLPQRSQHISTNDASVVMLAPCPDISPLVGLLISGWGSMEYQHVNSGAEKSCLAGLGVRTDLSGEQAVELSSRTRFKLLEANVGSTAEYQVVVCDRGGKALADGLWDVGTRRGAVVQVGSDPDHQVIWLVEAAQGPVQVDDLDICEGLSSIRTLLVEDCISPHDMFCALAPSMPGTVVRDGLVELSALMFWISGLSSNIQAARDRVNQGILEGAGLLALELLIDQSRQIACQKALEADSVLDHICKQRYADVAAAKAKVPLSDLMGEALSLEPPIDLYHHLINQAGCSGGCFGTKDDEVERDLDWARSEQHRQAQSHTTSKNDSTRFSELIPNADGTAVIAEIKRASPSKGNILPDADVAAFAKAYTQGGAAAISVLTEPVWFKGNLEDLRVARQASEAAAPPGSRPAILRKDFIIDEYQMFEARVAGADTALLIVAVLDQGRLVQLIEAARGLGMEPLVEVATHLEMDRALASGARVIGINNRNLHNFSVDMERTERLLAAVKHHPTVVMVALSGITGRVDVQRFASCGVRAVLVGEWLMRRSNPTGALRSLRGTEAGQPIVKICGLRDEESAVMTVRAGADLIGLVFAKSSRQVSAQEAASIVEAIHSRTGTAGKLKIQELAAAKGAHLLTPNDLRVAARCGPLTVGVFADQTPDEVNRLAVQSNIDIIQLSGSNDVMESCSSPVYVLPVIGAVHVGNDAKVSSVLANLLKVSPRTGLLDTKLGPAHGGTGIAFDWQLAQAVAALGSLNGLEGWFLAGGLNPNNVEEAVQLVKPYGLDISSGVETNGTKDLVKITDFIAKAKQFE